MVNVPEGQPPEDNNNETSQEQADQTVGLPNLFGGERLKERKRKKDKVEDRGNNELTRPPDLAPPIRQRRKRISDLFLGLFR